MTWSELASLQRHAAKHLLGQRDARLYRACCTRAYYAAYAAITQRIPVGTVFAHGWKNPGHEALRGYVDQIAGLSSGKKDAIRIALSQLRQRREDADYRPWELVNRTVARESLRDLTTILVLLPGD